MKAIDVLTKSLDALRWITQLTGDAPAPNSPDCMAAGISQVWLDIQNSINRLALTAAGDEPSLDEHNTHIRKLLMLANHIDEYSNMVVAANPDFLSACAAFEVPEVVIAMAALHHGMSSAAFNAEFNSRHLILMLAIVALYQAAKALGKNQAALGMLSLANAVRFTSPVTHLNTIAPILKAAGGLANKGLAFNAKNQGSVGIEKLARMAKQHLLDAGEALSQKKIWRKMANIVGDDGAKLDGYFIEYDKDKNAFFSRCDNTGSSDSRLSQKKFSDEKCAHWALLKK